MKNVLSIIAILAATTAQALIPRTVSISGDGCSEKYGDLYAVNTASEAGADGSRYLGLLSTKYADITININSSGDGTLYVTVNNLTVWSANDITTSGSASLPDNAIRQIIGGNYVTYATNVVVQWGSDGLFGRIINKTKYPVTLYGETYAGFRGITYSPKAFNSKVASLDLSDLKSGSTVTIDYLDSAQDVYPPETYDTPGVYLFYANLGRIRITATNPCATQFVPIYSDMLANTELPLYGKLNTILYGSPFLSSDTNITAFFEWQFEQPTNTVHAFVNDVDVCSHHNTSHIVDYTITTGPISSSYNKDTGCYTFDYTMTSILDPTATISCTFVTWLSADTSCKASYTGYSSDKPKFRAIYNRFAGKWSLNYIGN